MKFSPESIMLMDHQSVNPIFMNTVSQESLEVVLHKYEYLSFKAQVTTTMSDMIEYKMTF